MNYTSKEVYEFISQKNNDPIVEWKICKVSGTEFPIYESDLKFYDKISPTINGVKYQIPTPTLCPEERQRRRLAWRNERKLYKRKCDATGETIISMYSPDKAYKVYDQKVWWSDNWNPMDYARNFDFSRSFFEQFNELFLEVPKTSLFVGGIMENSDYNNLCGYMKNCYLCFDSGMNENTLFSSATGYIQDCMDVLGSINSRNSFEILDSSGVSNSFYIQSCNDCSNSELLINCNNCEYCFGCINLSNKKYHILNKPFSESKYNLLLNKVKSSHSEMRKFLMEVNALFSESIVKYYSGSQNSFTNGDRIFNSKNIKFSYGVMSAENSSYSDTLFPEAYDCYDIHSFCENSKLCIELVGSGGKVGLEHLSNSGFAANVYYGGYNIWYSVNMHGNSRNCFACCDLHNAEYCILNKQYSKEEYELLVPQIIEHMQKTGERGEFFPIELSPFGYNETVAQEYYPLSAAEAGSKNYKWQTNNYDPQIPEGVEAITKDNVPQDIQNVTEDILKKLFICEVTGRPFRIIKQELEFYKKHNVPLPTKHPDQRHLERLSKRNPRKLWKRTCMCENCSQNNKTDKPIEFLTTYSPERTEKVYCEVCYNKEMYG